MTKIALVHGLGDTQQRAVGLKTDQYIPFANLTSGEFRLWLAWKELLAAEHLYPEFGNIARTGKDLIENALNMGLHTGGHRVLEGRHIPNELKNVATLIRVGKNRYAPASGNFFANRPSPAHIGDPIIPTRICSPGPIPPNWQGPTSYYYMQWSLYERPKCELQLKFENAVNKHIEKAAAHLLYEFQTGNLNALPTTVTVKTLQHRAVIGVMASIGKWKRDDLREWIRLGVKLSNANAGNGLLVPEDSILGLKKFNKEADLPHINSLTLAVMIVFVTKVLIPALAAITGLILATKGIKADDPNTKRLNEWPNIGQSSFSPDKDDWSGFDTDTSNGNNSSFSLDQNTLLLAGGALALFALSGKK